MSDPSVSIFLTLARKALALLWTPLARKWFPLKTGGIDVYFHAPQIYFRNDLQGATLQIWPKVKNFSGYDIEVRSMTLFIGQHVRFNEYGFRIKQGEEVEMEMSRFLTDAEWKYFSEKGEVRKDDGFSFVYRMSFRSMLGEGKWGKSLEGQTVKIMRVN